MTVAAGSARSGVAWRSRTRYAGATATAALLLGTTALAPLSMASAFADAGGPAPLNAARGQALTSAAEANRASMAGVEVEGSEIARDRQAKPKQAGEAPRTALYSLEQFLFSGVINWGGYRFTFYSQKVLPGSGLAIPGRHVNEAGYVSDTDGYIVLAGDAPKGTVFETPFGYQGKVYDRGTFGNHLDVYIQ